MKPLSELSDNEFAATWRGLDDDERAALPDEVRSAGYRRYRELTPWISSSVERLRDGSLQRIGQVAD